VPGSGTVANSALPNLGLNRVYVLTTSGTCSASESVINGLRGVDVEVIVIGASTCGKPYGFTARDNCGLSYFPVEFQGINQKGFGEFADGFAPTCAVGDDLNNPLGSETEGLLAAALAYRGGASCAAIAAGDAALKAAGATGQAAAVGPIVRPPSRSNKFLMP
jgi:carboxyl-terminal processing protease